jgi:hypothetical protein
MLPFDQAPQDGCQLVWFVVVELEFISYAPRVAWVDRLFCVMCDVCVCARARARVCVCVR